MIRFLSKPNNIDVTRFPEVTTPTNSDVVFLTTGSGRKKCTLQNVAAYMATSIVNAIIPTGIIVPWLSTTTPSGWVMASGKTIGSSASGATERANSDTAALFSVVWQNFSNDLYPIQDSSGAPTTRGVSAAADFAANKRLPLPDARDRVIIGLANMGGSDAARISTAVTDVIGSSGGSDITTLTSDNLPEHTHDTLVPGITVTSAATGTDVPTPSVATATTSSSVGESEPIETLNPFITLPFIIKL